ncbi:MAG TPA: cytidylate kinase-like family protein [Anaerolineales bacterium]|nr:cytidylate kinase-like family protein [Anaerolineales bacterium]
MAVITVSRQLGSLGSQVASETARMLGYRLAWRDLINESALRAGAPGTALAVIDDLDLLGISLSKKEIRAFRKALRQVMEELYDGGNVVILGRAGQIILRERPGVLHVRVVAPAKLRAERVAARYQISHPNAVARVEASDKNHRKFLKRFFKIDWDDPQFYDLLINTAHLDAIQNARLIVQAVSPPPDDDNVALQVADQ